MKCGTSRRCITPPEEQLKDLIGLKDYHFSGVLDDLYLRVIALGEPEQAVLLISYDMNVPPVTESLLSRLTEATGVPAERIVAFATHTHSVPVTALPMRGRKTQQGESLAAATAWLADLEAATLSAAREALAGMRPARMGWAWGESHINVVRLQTYQYTDENGGTFPVCNLGADPAAYADPTLFTLRVETMEGAPLAFLVNYAVHNVATIWNHAGRRVMSVSGDVAGNVSQLLEKNYPGSVAIWSPGASGDLNPLMLNEIILPDPATGRTYEEHVPNQEFAKYCLKIMTERHYADVVRTLSQITCCAEGSGTDGCLAWSVTPGCDCIRHHGAPPEFLTGPDVPEHTVRLQLVRVGDLHLLGVGAELYSSIGRAMLKNAPENTVLITHDTSAICNSHYVLDDETIARCDASRGFAMVPGYDEYRCVAGVMKEDLCGHVRELTAALKERTKQA